MKKFFQKLVVRIMGSHMIWCEQASYLVSKKQHEKLSIREKFQLRMHHFICQFCKMYEKEINLISLKISEYVTTEKKGLNGQVKLPEKKKQEMAKVIYEHMQQ